MNLENIDLCSGCYCCYNICPKNCIDMVPDDEGFFYPSVNRNICVNCGICIKHCPVICNNPPTKYNIAFACINKNNNIRQESSSGGIFSLLAEHVINNNGVVFGAAFDHTLSVKHVAIDNIKDIKKLRGSKYVQSIIGDSYKIAKKYLDSGKLVLFSGTPCQISGLISFLNKPYNNLITQDFVCHGVASPSIWQKYLNHLSFAHKKNIEAITPPCFRDKKNGWKNFSFSITFKDGQKLLESHKKNLFMKLFLNNLCLRPSCYNCQFKSLNSQSDITLADFWGIKHISPDMYDDKGTSLLIVNTDKGYHLFNLLINKMKYKKIDFKTAVSYNSAIYNSVSQPPMRQTVFDKINEKNYKKIVRHCTPGITKKIIQYIHKAHKIIGLGKNY